MSDNPFLVGVELPPSQRAKAIAPGTSVRMRYHSEGSGLGGGRHDHDVTGALVGDDGFNIVVREHNGGVMNYAPHFWLDDIQVLDA